MGKSGEDERGFFSERWIEPPAKDKAAKDKSTETPHYHGHRDRLRERFVAGGADALPDYELLELLLFRLIPRVDTKPIAKALLARFGTFGEVLGAPVALLQEVKGIGPAVAVDLKVMAAAAQRMAKTEVHGREVLSNWTQLLAYIRSAMAFENREQFRILC